MGRFASSGERESFASEGGHWYRTDGTPCYTIIGKNGRERPTTLRDARALGLCPSVTTIIRGAAAPGLELWKVKQGILAALTLPREFDETDDSFLSRVLSDSKESTRKAAERGTLIHGALEKWYRDRTLDPAYEPHVAGAHDALLKECGWLDWRAERSFAHPFGYGGKCDLHSPGWVWDFKTKEFTRGDEPSLFDEHPMQLAAYRRGFDVPTARCGIVFVSASEPGLVVLREVPEPDLQRGLRMFDCLLTYWQEKAQFRPVFELAAA